MKKTIVAAAIAAVVSAPAFADVKVSGLVHMAINSTDTGSSAVDQTAIADNVSRFIISGSEDLGNGMSVDFKMEQQVAMDTGADITSARESYIGLNTDMGRLQMGRLYGPAKRLFSGAEQAGDTAIDITALSQTTTAENTEDNAIEYISPNMNGLQLRVSMANDSEGTNNTDLGEVVDYSITYSNSGLTVGYANVSDSDSTAANDQDAFLVKYSMGDITVAYAELDPDGVNKHSAASASYKMGNNTLVVQYGEEKTSSGTEDGWGAALVHSMSKQTSVYAGLRDSEVENDNSTAVSLGVKHSF